MVFGFGKNKKKDVRKETQGILGNLKADDLLAEGRAERSSLADVPAGIDPGDAPKWRKLQKLLVEHDSFKLQTFDGLYWLDPFSGEFISAPFDLEATIHKHFAENHHWMGGKLKPYRKLRQLVWERYLEENLQQDQRFVLFLEDGSWYDPWTRTPDPELRIEHLEDRDAFVTAVAARMAAHEGSNPREMLGFENLKRVMLGIEPEPEDDEADKDAGENGENGGIDLGSHAAKGGGLQPVRATEAMRRETRTQTEMARAERVATTGAAQPDDEPVIEGDDSFGTGFGQEGPAADTGPGSDIDGQGFKLELGGQAGGAGGGAPSNEQIFEMMQQLVARLPATMASSMQALPASGGALSNQDLYRSMQVVDREVGEGENSVLPELGDADQPSNSSLMQALQRLQQRIEGVEGASGGGPVAVPGTASVGTMPAVPGGAAYPPGALPPSHVAGQVRGSIGGQIIPPGSVVVPAAQQLFDGLISLRDTALSRDEEEAQAGQEDGQPVPSDSFHVPGNVPVMRQNELSADVIQKLVDSLQRVSLVASSVADTRYHPDTKGGSSSALTSRREEEDAFAAVDRESGAEETQEKRSQVSTAAFIDPESDLDIDRVFARLQAREARDSGEEGEGEDDGFGLEDDELGMSSLGFEDDDALEEFDVEEEEADEAAVADEAYDDHAEDMAKAVNVQNHLLGGIPALDGVAIALHYVPYAEIGGDFYNVLKIDDERFFFIVGDVSGHGVQAALIVSSLVNTLRIIFRDREDWNLLDILAELNGYMRECFMTGQFITAFAGIVTIGEEAFIECACAGHHQSICINPGTHTPLRELGGKGMGIGLVRSSVFRQNTDVQREPLRSGDMICIYTDGIVEVNDEYGEELGDNFARNSFIAHMDVPLEDLIDTMIGDIMAESDGNIADDQTVMVVKVL